MTQYVKRWVEYGWIYDNCRTWKCWKQKSDSYSVLLEIFIWRASSIPGTRAIVLRQCIVFSSQNSALYSTRLLNQIMRFLGGIK